MLLANGVTRNSRIIAQRAAGCWITDTQGREYLDMTSGIGALSTGHSHPRVLEAAARQLTNIVHAQQNCVYSYPAQQRLLQQLRDVLPAALDAVFFTNSGSEAVENAIKVARAFTGRPNIVSFIGGFHGRTLGCMSLSSSRVSCRQGFQPLLPGVFQLPYPDDPRRFRDDLRTLFERQCAPEETAAVLLEPVLGEGGVRAAHAEAVQHLRAACDAHGILWISDEVQTGVGRTGAWWGYEHFGSVTPDLVTFGKGLASGFPLAGVAAGAPYFDALQSNGLGGTYNGNAIATAAASATLDVLRDEDLVRAAADMGRQLAQNIRDMCHPRVQEVRQYGLMLGIDVDASPTSFAATLAGAADRHSVLLLSSGVRPTFRLLPPLLLTETDMDFFEVKFRDVLDELSAA